VNGRWGYVLYLAQAINGPTQRVKHPPARTLAHRHGDLLPQVQDLHSPGQADRRAQADAAHSSLIDVLVNLDHAISKWTLDQQCPQHRRQYATHKPHINHWSNDPANPARVHVGSRSRYHRKNRTIGQKQLTPAEREPAFYWCELLSKRVSYLLRVQQALHQAEVL
jgi:hypothetical protein